MHLAKNAAFNLMRGGVGALVALILPPLLVRTLTISEYSAWVLILQLGSYVGYLDFGVQTAVGRFVALATELKDDSRRNAMVSAAWVLLIVAGIMGLTLVILLTWLMHTIIPQMPTVLVATAQFAFVLVGGSLALALPFSTSNGVFVGLERNEIPALLTAGGKILGACLVAVAAIWQLGLIWMSAGLALATALTAVVQWFALKRWAPDVKIDACRVERGHARELARYCIGLTVLNAAMLLISGLDTVIVGAYDYPAVAPYAIASSLVLFVGSLQTALFSPLIPRAAALNARRDDTRLGDLLLVSTRLGVVLLLIVAIPLVVFSEPVLDIWVGSTYAAQAKTVLIVLTIANALRWSLSPYANILIGTGQQRIMLLTPLIESVVNLVMSLVLVSRIGAVGVAYGTLIGTVAAFLGNVIVNMPATRGIAFRTTDYVIKGFLAPVLLMCPAAMVLQSIVVLKLPMVWSALAVFASLGLTAFVAVRSGFLGWTSKGSDAR